MEAGDRNHYPPAPTLDLPPPTTALPGTTDPWPLVKEYGERRLASDRQPVGWSVQGGLAFENLKGP